ncbi:MAG: IS630 family transposase [Methanobacteriota archaeon]
MDESGASLTPLVGKTWAPRGTTPVLLHNFRKWDKVSMISAVGSNRKLHFQFKLQESFKHGDVAKFLRHLLRHVKGRLVVFLDNAQQHKGSEVSAVGEAYQDRLLVLPLPPYGFDYNPDEGVWTHLKWAQLKNLTPHDTDELVAELRKGLRRSQRRPRLVASFFLESKLPKNDVRVLLNRAGRL